jgi:tight adherence protein C
MTPSVILLGVGISGLIACVGCLLFQHVDRYGNVLRARLREVPKSSADPLKRNFRDALAERIRQRPTTSFSGILNHFVPNRDEDRRKHQSRLMHAGIYSSTALTNFFAIKFGLMVIPLAVSLSATGLGVIEQPKAVLLGAVGGGIGMLLPSFWLDRQIGRRHRLLRKGLPDFLDLTTVCLEGGLSLQGTLQRVGAELKSAHPVLAGELAIVQREADLGVSVHAALQHMADRTGCDGMRQLGIFVRDAQRQGSELADALRVHADSLRSQREAEAEEAAQKASVKILIPTLFFIFPAVFVVLAGPAAIRIHDCFSQAEGVTVKE